MWKWLRNLLGRQSDRDNGGWITDAGRLVLVERPSQAIGDVAPQTPNTRAKWIRAADNDFGIDVVDCTAFCRSIHSMTNDVDMAFSFSHLRGSVGEEYRGKSPPNAVTLNCSLSFPQVGRYRDGPLFKAQEMEEKWDIYLYDSKLYFSRSWSGDLVFTADIAFGEDRVRITSITAKSGPETETHPGYVIGTVDYLIKSHIYRYVVPHPIPEGFSNDPDAIACWSFNAYGRYAAFASRENTMQVRGSDADSRV